MKRLSLFFTLILLAIVASPSLLAAGGKCGENCKWQLESGLLRITGYGKMDDYGSGNSPWFPPNVKYLEIEEGITQIGKGCFAGSKITTVKIPMSVTVISDKAFEGCKQLSVVEFTYGLKEIGNNAFANCDLLHKAILPASLDKIGDKAFYKCKSLGVISLPSRMHHIGVEAFAKCNVEQILELPDFVTPNFSARYGLSSNTVDSYYSHHARQIAESELEPKSKEKKDDNDKKHGVKESGVKYGDSDVDKNIPQRAQNNVNTFAIIIANENYTSLADVPYAINDGTSFATYCRSVLGLPDSNISFYKDATYLSIREALAWLRDVDAAYKGDINVIFYYAGHGMPDEATHEAYLVPTDAYRAVKDVCYPLKDLYASLGSLQAGSVKVFLDACFSGATPDGGVIEKGRSIAIVPKASAVEGNMVVLSATSGDQTAWQYDRQGHGMFTYFLLKKLQESSGETSMGELCEYICDRVGKASIVENRKSQTPSVIASPRLGNKWRYWTVK